MNQGILNADEAEELELWIKFRNILVHGYATIDTEELYKALSEVDRLSLIIKKIYDFTTKTSIEPEPKHTDAPIERIRRVLEDYDEVLFAYLFGSRAVGKESTYSDVDIAIYMEGD